MQRTFTLDELPEVASAFLQEIGGRRLFAFEGEMGAGKTTFISEVCRQLGATDDFGSPTFSILNEYEAENGEPIYHFDFYRLDEPQEALEIGVEDYFDSGHLCLMEWSDRLGMLLPEETVKVKITEEADGKRRLTVDEDD